MSKLFQIEQNEKETIAILSNEELLKLELEVVSAEHKIEQYFDMIDNAENAHVSLESIYVKLQDYVATENYDVKTLEIGLEHINYIYDQLGLKSEEVSIESIGSKIKDVGVAVKDAIEKIIKKIIAFFKKVIAFLFNKSKKTDKTSEKATKVSKDIASIIDDAKMYIGDRNEVIEKMDDDTNYLTEKGFVIPNSINNKDDSLDPVLVKIIIEKDIDKLKDYFINSTLEYSRFMKRYLPLLVENNGDKTAMNFNDYIQNELKHIKAVFVAFHDNIKETGNIINANFIKVYQIMFNSRYDNMGVIIPNDSMAICAHSRLESFYTKYNEFEYPDFVTLEVSDDKYKKIILPKFNDKVNPVNNTINDINKVLNNITKLIDSIWKEFISGKPLEVWNKYNNSDEYSYEKFDIFRDNFKYDSKELLRAISAMPKILNLYVSAIDAHNKAMGLNTK